ncbi:MAG: SCO family protein [Planctomycetes bacterium]|nr:SCO family protein [Planctomycetota bacterium]
MLTLALLGLLLAGTASPAQASYLAVIQTAPEFSLTTQEGATLRLSDLRGQVLLVSFVFTTCNGTCPATTHRMAQIQQELQARGLLQGHGIHLLSITLDPERDTPAVLQRYMRLYDLDPATWTFLTGPPESVQRTLTAWGMWARPTANGQLDHPSRVFLVDRAGRVREIYNLGFLKAPWVAEDVAALLREKE